MLPRILNWNRCPLDAVIRWGPRRRDARRNGYAYVFGSRVLLIFLLQVVTGLWQLLYFVPTIDRGYRSLNYLRTETPRPVLIWDVITIGRPLEMSSYAPVTEVCIR